MTSMTIFVKMSTRNKSETITVQKGDEFLRIFETLAGRVGIELPHIRLTFSGKEYRHDQPEARKRVEDIGIKDRSTLFLVSRLPTPVIVSEFFYTVHGLLQKGVGETHTMDKSHGKRRNIRGEHTRQRHAKMTAESQSKEKDTFQTSWNKSRVTVHTSGRSQQIGSKRAKYERPLFTGASDHPVTLQRIISTSKPHLNVGSMLPDIYNSNTRSPEYMQRTSTDKYHGNNNSQLDRAYITSDYGFAKRPRPPEEKNEAGTTKHMRSGPKVHTSCLFTPSEDRDGKPALHHNLPPDKISLKEKADESPSRPIQHENRQIISTPGETTITVRQPPQGLPNIGNTCYANSLLQALGQTPRLLEIYSESDARGVNQSKMNVTDAFRQVLQTMNHQTYGPSKSTIITQFMDIVSSREHEFRIGYQNDCHSFLLTLLSELNEGVLGKDIAQLFETEMVDQFTFDSCHHTEVTDTQILRSLTIPSESRNVEEGLQSLLQEEYFNEQDVPCRTCLKGCGRTRKSMMFRTQPRVLVLQLGCFQEMSYGGRLRIAKSSRRINFNEALRVPQKNRHSMTYQLYGVVNHHGSTYGGHYTSYVKHLSHQGDWYYCNDSHVTKSSLSLALASHDAYLLFYKIANSRIQ